MALISYIIYLSKLPVLQIPFQFKCRENIKGTNEYKNVEPKVCLTEKVLKVLKQKKIHKSINLLVLIKKTKD